MGSWSRCEPKREENKEDERLCCNDAQSEKSTDKKVKELRQPQQPAAAIAIDGNVNN